MRWALAARTLERAVVITQLEFAETGRRLWAMESRDGPKLADS